MALSTNHILESPGAVGTIDMTRVLRHVLAANKPATHLHPQISPLAKGHQSHEARCFWIDAYVLPFTTTLDV
jgi:hypothetical protein